MIFAVHPFSFPSLPQVILLCACAADEDLPTRPDLPADLFTACLTTPMRVVLEFASSDGLVGAA
jgi:regulator-associated protein of mTOR